MLNNYGIKLYKVIRIYVHMRFEINSLHKYTIYWTNYSNDLNYSIKYEICDIRMQSKFKKKSTLLNICIHFIFIIVLNFNNSNVLFIIIEKKYKYFISSSKVLFLNLPPWIFLRSKKKYIMTIIDIVIMVILDT